MRTISRESASMLNLLMEQIKALVEVSNNLNERTKESEKRINDLSVETQRTKEELKEFNEKMEIMEKNMEKFIGLYEVVTNQYNPFLESNELLPEDQETSVNLDNQNDNNKFGEPPKSTKEVSGNNVVVEDTITGQKTQVPPNPSADPNATAPNPANPQASQSTPVVQNTQAPPQTPASAGAGAPTDASADASVVDTKVTALPLSNGKSADNLQDLFEELVYMDDNVFRNHVNDSKHEIADWIANALGKADFAEKARALKTRSGLIKAISEYIHSLPAEQPTNNDLTLANGKTVNDLEGLLDELVYIDDTLLSTHIDAAAGKNEIADWIESKLNNAQLAAVVKPLATKGDLIKEIIKFLHEQNK
jgi:hypothetical protein